MPDINSEIIFVSDRVLLQDFIEMDFVGLFKVGTNKGVVTHTEFYSLGLAQLVKPYDLDTNFFGEIFNCPQGQRQLFTANALCSTFKLRKIILISLLMGTNQQVAKLPASDAGLR